MKKTAKKPVYLSSYVNQWLMGWMTFLFIAMITLLTVTALMGGIYSKGIRNHEESMERTAWHLEVRNTNLAYELMALQRELTGLTESTILPNNELLELLSSFHYGSGLASVLTFYYQDDEGWHSMRMEDADADGMLELDSAQYIHDANPYTATRLKSWHVVSNWRFSGIPKDEVQVLQFDVGITSGIYEGAILSASMSLLDVMTYLMDDMDHDTAAWVLVGPNEGQVYGSLGEMSNQSVTATAHYLTDKYDMLQNQIGYSRLRTDWFKRAAYVFRISLLSDWQYFCIVPSSILFHDEILMMQLLGACLIFVMLISLASGIRFSRLVTQGIVRLTKSVTEGKNGNLAAPAPHDPYEVQTLTEVFNHTIASLEDKNAQLQEEVERNTHLSEEISRYYSHLRLLNAHELHIDLFDYDENSHILEFYTGLITLYGSGSQICREMTAYRFFEEFAVEQELDAFEGLIQKAKDDANPPHLEFNAETMDGEPRTLRMWMTNGEITGRLTGVLMDVTAERKHQDELLSQSLRDSLTGLYDGHAIIRIAGQQIAAAPKGRPVFFVILRFEGYNEFEKRSGVASGIVLIRALAVFLKERINASDTLFRMRDTEFLVVFSDLTDEQSLVDRLMQWQSDCALAPWEKTGIIARLTLRIGYSVSGEHGDSPEVLAEQAAFACSRKGYLIDSAPIRFSPVRFLNMNETSRWLSALPGVLENNFLFLDLKAVTAIRTQSPGSGNTQSSEVEKAQSPGSGNAWYVMVSTAAEHVDKVDGLMTDVLQIGYADEYDQAVVQCIKQQWSEQLPVTVTDEKQLLLLLPLATGNSIDLYAHDIGVWSSQIDCRVVLLLSPQREQNSSRWQEWKAIADKEGMALGFEGVGVETERLLPLLSVMPDHLLIENESDLAEPLFESLIRTLQKSGTEVMI